MLAWPSLSRELAALIRPHDAIHNVEPAAGRPALVRSLQSQGLLRDPAVARALMEVPREAFVPPELREQAYADTPLPIGEGQTISAPHMVALMAQALDARPGHRVLEVGAGSGYHAAVLARLVAPGGRVVSVERSPALARKAEESLRPLGLPVELRVGDGSLGWPDSAPYDRISVAAAAPAVPPPLVEQLALDGVLVLPVGPLDLPSLLRIRRTAHGLQEESLGPVRFVPLLGRHGFPP